MSPFSEPESMALKDFLNKHPVKAYITLHSYSQLWLIPYGHKKKTYPDDYDDLLVNTAVVLWIEFMNGRNTSTRVSISETTCSESSQRAQPSTPNELRSWLRSRHSLRSF